MTSEIAAARDFVGQMMRLGWYTGIGALAERQARRAGDPPRKRPEGRVVPEARAVTADIVDLMRRDADLVRRGAAAPTEGAAEGLADYAVRLREMFRDMPDAVARRTGRTASSARDYATGADLPDYFVQDFHFQDGGYLSDKSARLYDVQVETLFRGSAQAMRRQALGPIAEFMHGRDQRAVSVLDMACGTGRLVRELRRVYPAVGLTGLDLSAPYLREAERHLKGLRPATWIEANAETMPLPDASQDIVACIYLFHELPPEVRRTVAREIARVLKPGGLFVFIDSLQKGDRDGGWDGFLEGFPERFHEPYYRHYTIDNLDVVFADRGLAAVSSWPAFLSKVMVRRKA